LVLQVFDPQFAAVAPLGAPMTPATIAAERIFDTFVNASRRLIGLASTRATSSRTESIL
jgi:hypothetical protein